MLGFDSSKEIQLQSSLNQWIEQVDPDTIDFSRLSLKSEIVGKIVSGATVVSVIHHGGIREEIPLVAISDKAIRFTSRA